MGAASSQNGLGRTLRRSKRLGLAVPVQVFGQNASRETFREYARTVSVSLHGGAVALAARLQQGQSVLVVNGHTREEQECRVTYVGPVKNGKWTVGIEFARPAESFWKIHFPPHVPGRTESPRRPSVYAQTPQTKYSA